MILLAFKVFDNFRIFFSFTKLKNDFDSKKVLALKISGIRNKVSFETIGVSISWFDKK